jgi:DNA recombination protein RmuC
MEVPLAYVAVAGAGLVLGGLAVLLILRFRMAETEKAHRERLALLEEAQQKLSDAFKALAAEALRSNNQMFLDLARETLAGFHKDARSDLESRQRAIDELVRPLNESLGRVDSSIQEMEKARAAAYAGVSEQVKALAAAQEALRSETANLVHALRSPAVRGRWGEVQLRRVVELAGMIAYCDFEEQAVAVSDGGRLRPDMIIRLPNGRQVIVDAKVPLKAYLEALETGDEAARAAKLKEHAGQLRTHIDRLGGKAYWAQFDATPEFVVAFVPGEAFFSAALQQDPELIEHGVGRQVILATPTTLIALLKAVAYGWRQEKLAQNAQEISDLGRTLYERLRTFAGHLEQMGRNLEQTVAGFNRAVASLETRVLVSARKFQDLGAAGPEEIPALEPVEAQPRALAAAAESPGADSGEDTQIARTR